MSVIAVKKFENHVEIAADTQITADMGRIMTALEFKLINHDGIAIGFSGDAAISTFMHLYLEQVEFPELSVENVRSFIVAFHEYAEKISVADYNLSGGSFIFASHDRAIAAEDYFVIEVDEMYSIGTGMELCEAMMRRGATPKEVVEETCKVSIYCSAPIEEYRIFPDKMEYNVYE